MSFIGLDKHETKFDEEIENITTSEETYNSQVIFFLFSTTTGTNVVASAPYVRATSTSYYQPIVNNGTRV